MTTTRNKITIREIINKSITINALEADEFIQINRDDYNIMVRIDEIPFLISSLQRFLENGEIVET